MALHLYVGKREKMGQRKQSTPSVASRREVTEEGRKANVHYLLQLGKKKGADFTSPIYRERKEGHTSSTNGFLI